MDVDVRLAFETCERTPRACTSLSLVPRELLIDSRHIPRGIMCIDQAEEVTTDRDCAIGVHVVCCRQLVYLYARSFICTFPSMSPARCLRRVSPVPSDTAGPSSCNGGRVASGRGAAGNLPRQLFTLEISSVRFLQHHRLTRAHHITHGCPTRPLSFLDTLALYHYNTSSLVSTHVTGAPMDNIARGHPPALFR